MNFFTFHYTLNRLKTYYMAVYINKKYSEINYEYSEK
jgi:hypothetical protein